MRAESVRKALHSELHHRRLRGPQAFRTLPPPRHRFVPLPRPASEVRYSGHLRPASVLPAWCSRRQYVRSTLIPSQRDPQTISLRRHLVR